MDLNHFDPDAHPRGGDPAPPPDGILGALPADVSRLVAELNGPWGGSKACTKCGKCVQVCPTGALFEKNKVGTDHPKHPEFLPYLKADHFAKGLSMLFGYCYTQKDRDCVNPLNTSLFNPVAVNVDQRFRSWNMHVFHFMTEYDFTKDATDILPRIGIFYNYILSGKRIFDTSIVSAYWCLDCSWEF